MDFAKLSPCMKPVDVSWHPEFDEHELVLEIDDPSGLRAFIAVHRFFFHEHLGRPSALGGTRIYDYLTDYDAITDVLRLSRGMTYKAAWAETGFGGAKAVIMRKPEDRGAPISPEMQRILSAYASYVNILCGTFVTAEDSGFYEKYATYMKLTTQWIAGAAKEAGGSGDPSLQTAHGVFLGIKSCLAHHYGPRHSSLKGCPIAIQGVGGVGLPLSRLLERAGARLFIADKNEKQLMLAKRELGDGVSVVPPDKIHSIFAEVFAPCALGAVLNERTIPELSCEIVAGAANNQLATPEDGERLYKRGILYAPDYVISAVGLMRVAREFKPDSQEQGAKTVDLERIPRNLVRIFQESERTKLPPSRVADEIARTLIQERVSEREALSK